MTNHANRVLTPKRKEFLLSAKSNGGCIEMQTRRTAADYWKTEGPCGMVTIRYDQGLILVHAGLIERVKKEGSHSTERTSNGGFKYRLTPAAIMALA